MNDVLKISKTVGCDNLHKNLDQKLCFCKNTAVKARKFRNMLKLGEKAGSSSCRKIQLLSSCPRLFWGLHLQSLQGHLETTEILVLVCCCISLTPSEYACKQEPQRECITSSQILMSHLANFIPIHNPSSLLEMLHVKQLRKTKRILTL